MAGEVSLQLEYKDGFSLVFENMGSVSTNIRLGKVWVQAQEYDVRAGLTGNKAFLVGEVGLSMARIRVIKALEGVSTAEGTKECSGHVRREGASDVLRRRQSIHPDLSSFPPCPPHPSGPFHCPTHGCRPSQRIDREGDGEEESCKTPDNCHLVGRDKQVTTLLSALDVDDGRARYASVLLTVAGLTGLSDFVQVIGQFLARRSTC